jgi:hypothetical protein
MPLASTLASTVFAAFIVSILQFPNKNTGDFNTGDGTNDMNTLFDLARINLLSNMTLHIKGWVGPVIQQEGQYPPSISPPLPRRQRGKSLDCSAITPSWHSSC